MADVLAEDVAAEVVCLVAPGGVDVVSVVLDVGYLDQERGALDAVVIRLATLEAAGPAETEVPEVGLNFREVTVGELLAVAVGELGDEFHERSLLGYGHVGCRDANGIELLRLAVRSGEDLARRFLRINDFLAAFLESGGDGAGEVFLGSQRTGALHFVIDHDLTRIRCEKGRSDRHRVAMDDRVIQRKMMPLETPAPCASGFRLAEDRCEIVLRIAEVRAFLDLPEESLKRHDRIHLNQARLADCGFQKGSHKCRLLHVEIRERQPFALAWDEAPVLALIGFEGKTRFL